MSAPSRSHGKTVVRINNQCIVKRRYSDEFTARAMGRYQSEQEQGKKLWLYRCDICRGWHLTKHPGPMWLSVHYNYAEVEA